MTSKFRYKASFVPMQLLLPPNLDYGEFCAYASFITSKFRDKGSIVPIKLA